MTDREHKRLINFAEEHGATSNNWYGYIILHKPYAIKVDKNVYVSIMKAGNLIQSIDRLLKNNPYRHIQKVSLWIAPRGQHKKTLYF